MDIYLKNKNFPDKYYLINGGEFSVLTDRLIGWSYCLCEEYDIIEKINKNEEGYFDFSKSLIDVGSEDGSYMTYLNFKENHCFEPNKNMCCLIYANMFLKDKVDNTFVYNVLLGKDDGVSPFNGFCEEGYPIFDMITGRDFNKGTYNVERRKLDDYNIKNVGLIKVDVEGAECDVLRGGVLTIIENGFPPILFESHAVGSWGQTQEKRDEIFNFLKLLGYEIIENWGNDSNHLAIKR